MNDMNESITYPVASPPVASPFRTPVKVWLLGVCLLIATLVAVGGVTRLTESGLSITRWKPITGIVPPLSEQAWQAEFDQYRASPEFLELRPGMSLSEFKGIYFWEYLHRLLGRLVGFVFLAPFLVFLVRKAFSRRMTIALWIAFMLGGLQGVVGWFMVKSGLVDIPYVSHYRLALHLGLALVLFAYLFYLALAAGDPGAGPPVIPSGLVTGAVCLFSVVVLQIVYGAFTAGLNAGYFFNTFPTMMGYWIPPGMDSLTPAWRNLFDNPIAVQFIHRTNGWIILFATSAYWLYGVRRLCDRGARAVLHLLFAVTAAQFILGALTLLTRMNIPVAVLHQVTACILLAVYVLLFFLAGKGRGRRRAHG